MECDETGVCFYVRYFIFYDHKIWSVWSYATNKHINSFISFCHATDANYRHKLGR